MAAVARAKTQVPQVRLRVGHPVEAKVRDLPQLSLQNRLFEVRGGKGAEGEPMTIDLSSTHPGSAPLVHRQWGWSVDEDVTTTALREGARRDPSRR